MADEVREVVWFTPDHLIAESDRLFRAGRQGAAETLMLRASAAPKGERVALTKALVRMLDIADEHVVARSNNKT